jgi:capping protein alpha
MAANKEERESKLNIATYFIMNAPTGEVNAVLSDVTKLVDDPKLLTEPVITKIMHDYNVDHLWVAEDPDTRNMVVVSPYNEVSPEHYYDPISGRVIRFDHRLQRFQSQTPADKEREKRIAVEPEMLKYRMALQKNLNDYLEGSFIKGKVVGVVFPSLSSSSPSKMTIAISARNVNLASFWTGNWRSTYTINLANGANDLRGSIKIRVHYFEDGNVQLHNAVDKSASITITSDIDKTASTVINAINKIESDFHAQLEEMYVNMHSQTFKSMRRFYPITGTTMVWNPHAHAMVQEMGLHPTKKDEK